MTAAIARTTMQGVKNKKSLAKNRRTILDRDIEEDSVEIERSNKIAQ
jgi:hypothetical protein